MMKVCLSTAYLPPIEYFSWLMKADEALIEQYEHYQKQTYRNRCTIVGPEGKLDLTVPVVKPDRKDAPIRDIRISDHGNWRHLHWNALSSAYNHTPYFEYFRDDFQPFYERKWEFLVDYNEELLTLICQLINVSPVFSRTQGYKHVLSSEYVDLRDVICPKTDYRVVDSAFVVKPYYQVFADRNGFFENVSVVDLLFNMGPESVFYLGI